MLLGTFKWDLRPLEAKLLQSLFPINSLDWLFLRDLMKLSVLLFVETLSTRGKGVKSFLIGVMCLVDKIV